jgi:hypothetical protein
MTQTVTLQTTIIDVLNFIEMRCSGHENMEKWFYKRNRLQNLFINLL